MLIDTHCHLNMIVKKKFDVTLSQAECDAAQMIVNQAAEHHVSTIINVGTSFVESENCVTLAQQYHACYATVGIHPNDCTSNWKEDFKKIAALARQKQKNKVIGIGECGIDLHYPHSNLPRQRDAFQAHIDLALEHDLALVIHSRDAYDETLRALEQFKHDIKRATIHCFSYDLMFAQQIIAWKWVIGIDAPITYPKNDVLRNVVSTIGLDHIVLETDAPFLPPHHLRGKENHPIHIYTIATYIANLLGMSVEEVAQKTTKNARKLFGL